MATVRYVKYDENGEHDGVKEKDVDDYKSVGQAGSDDPCGHCVIIEKDGHNDVIDNATLVTVDDTD